MRAIIISEKDLDKEFQDTLTELELDKLKTRIENVRDWSAIEDLYRKFHYEVCRLKEKLKAA